MRRPGLPHRDRGALRGGRRPAGAPRDDELRGMRGDAPGGGRLRGGRRALGPRGLPGVVERPPRRRRMPREEGLQGGLRGDVLAGRATARGRRGGRRHRGRRRRRGQVEGRGQGAGPRRGLLRGVRPRVHQVRRLLQALQGAGGRRDAPRALPDSRPAMPRAHLRRLPQLCGGPVPHRTRGRRVLRQRALGHGARHLAASGVVPGAQPRVQLRAVPDANVHPRRAQLLCAVPRDPPPVPRCRARGGLLRPGVLGCEVGHQLGARGIPLGPREEPQLRCGAGVVASDPPGGLPHAVPVKAGASRRCL
mmetsp:Transcript_73475/g.206317  ORF Transcript_73475/g.206317 Transcript_73475/m.206317 type:complete len:306 (-) Transcript_73475:169-1086(-)